MLSMPVSKLLRKFAAPAMLAMSANGIFNICDILIISRGVGLDAIAGLTCAFPIVIFISAIAALTNVGATTQISMLYAKGDQEKALKVFGNALLMIIFLGTLVSAIFEIYIEDILRLCGASNVTLPYAVEI